VVRKFKIQYSNRAQGVEKRKVLKKKKLSLEKEELSLVYYKPV